MRQRRSTTRRLPWYPPEMKRFVMIVALGGVALASCTPAARQAEISTAIEADKNACRAQIFSKKVQFAQCINNAERKLAAAYPHPDLLSLRLANRLVIAERQDKGLLSDAEAELRFARGNAQIASQEQTRSAQASMARTAAVAATPTIQPIQFQSTYQPPQQDRFQATCRTMAIGNSLQTNCN